MKLIALLISNTGTGTNLQAIIDGVNFGKINAKIVAVISDTSDAIGLERARKHQLPIKICPKKQNLLSLLKKLNPDFICLAGWKQIILDEVIESFPNRIVNLHPGLIPDSMDGKVLNPDGSWGLWNRGKLTDQAVQNFLDNGATYAGSTIHFLSKDFDFGLVLGRCFEKVQKGDSIDSLYTRLKKKENRLYVDILAKLCQEGKMNILVIGSNGREHALAATYAKSKKVKKVIMTPGNGLTDYHNKKIKNYPSVTMMDFEGIVKVCQKEKIDVVDVAQDDVIAAGYVDRLEKLGIAAFGPTKKASQLEWDKEWARNFMAKYGLPIPKFRSFSNKKEATSYVKSLPEQLLYVKAAGLVGGKGAIRAENKKQAIEAIKSMSQFGKSGETFLIEQALIGEEFSLFAISDGEDFVVAKSAQDHKTIYDGDLGPNTGGMGSVAPTGCVTASMIRIIGIKIFKPLLKGMKKEERPYKGILYLGGMLTKDGVKIIEFNSRWGDPEAEVILPSIQTDYLDLVQAVRLQKIKNTKVVFDKKVRLSVAGCSKGYPGDYSSVKGKEIFGLIDARKMPGITIFGAGIKREGNKFFVNGGRIFHLVAEGKNVIEAKEKAYKAMAKISIEGNNLHYRTDIGWRDINRIKN
ncbi:phosphoribosylamine--glycine ligase [Candidatus Daviesbacteria bacterium]|nr:phosphoribosylamine--glycine ligase [Candidatus Daviesbacteria bacterium]